MTVTAVTVTVTVTAVTVTVVTVTVTGVCVASALGSLPPVRVHVQNAVIVCSRLATRCHFAASPRENRAVQSTFTQRVWPGTGDLVAAIVALQRSACLFVRMARVHRRHGLGPSAGTRGLHVNLLASHRTTGQLER